MGLAIFRKIRITLPYSIMDVTVRMHYGLTSL